MDDFKNELEELIGEIEDSSEMMENYNGEIVSVSIPVGSYRRLLEMREDLWAN